MTPLDDARQVFGIKAGTLFVEAKRALVSLWRTRGTGAARRRDGQQMEEGIFV